MCNMKLVVDGQHRMQANALQTALRDLVFLPEIGVEWGGGVDNSP